MQRASFAVSRPAVTLRTLGLFRPDPLAFGNIVGESACWRDDASRDQQGTDRGHCGDLAWCFGEATASMRMTFLSLIGMVVIDADGNSVRSWFRLNSGTLDRYPSRPAEFARRSKFPLPQAELLLLGRFLGCDIVGRFARPSDGEASADEFFVEALTIHETARRVRGHRRRVRRPGRRSQALDRANSADRAPRPTNTARACRPTRKSVSASRNQHRTA